MRCWRTNSQSPRESTLARTPQFLTRISFEPRATNLHAWRTLTFRTLPHGNLVQSWSHRRRSSTSFKRAAYRKQSSSVKFSGEQPINPAALQMPIGHIYPARNRDRTCSRRHSSYRLETDFCRIIHTECFALQSQRCTCMHAPPTSTRTHARVCTTVTPSLRRQRISTCGRL